jgi:hypothetical protein
VELSATGRSVALLLQSGSSNGWAAIWVDGKRVASVKLTAASSAHTKVAYVAGFATAGVHHIRIVNLSSGAHGVLGFDGMVVLA